MTRATLWRLVLLAACITLFVAGLAIGPDHVEPEDRGEEQGLALGDALASSEAGDQRPTRSGQGPDGGSVTIVPAAADRGPMMVLGVVTP